jgi:hypothetical protein
MRKQRLCKSVFALSLSAVTVCGTTLTGRAQQMEHPAPSAPSTQLTIKTYDGKTIMLAPADVAALPHKQVTVLNAHTKANETYSGVPLTDLLSKAGVPSGEAVRGKLFLVGVVAQGTDGYGVLYALGEVDPAIHTGEVIVADSMDGQKLVKDGAFKLISTEERRPARWVRNLTTISVVKVEP